MNSLVPLDRLFFYKKPQNILFFIVNKKKYRSCLRIANLKLSIALVNIILYIIKHSIYI